MSISVSAGKAYITQTWRSGANWWRKWSDGYIEQGGQTSLSFASWKATLTFHTNFSTTGYFLNWVMVDDYYDGYYQHSIPTKRVNNAVIVEIHRAGNLLLHWYACGF